MKFRYLALGLSLLVWSAFLASIITEIVSIDTVAGIAISSIIAFVGGVLFTSGARGVY